MDNKRQSSERAMRGNIASLAVDLLGIAAGLLLVWQLLHVHFWSSWQLISIVVIVLSVAPVRLHAKLWRVRVAGTVICCLTTVMGVLSIAFAVGVTVWELAWTDLDRLMAVRGDVILFYSALGGVLVLKAYMGFRRRARRAEGPKYVETNDRLVESTRRRQLKLRIK
jgi:hypothetical protein